MLRAPPRSSPNCCGRKPQRIPRRQRQVGGRAATIVFGFFSIVEHRARAQDTERSTRFLPRYLRALLARFRKPNRNRLLPARHPSTLSSLARLQRAPLPPPHRALHGFPSRLPITSHVSSHPLDTNKDQAPVEHHRQPGLEVQPLPRKSSPYLDMMANPPPQPSPKAFRISQNYLYGACTENDTELRSRPPAADIQLPAF